MNNKNLNNIKSHGFKIPEGYFESFDEKILGELNKESRLKTMESGFKTPKNYFNTVENIIIKQVSEQNNIKVISIFNKKNMIYVTSIAAAVLLLFNLSIFEKNPSFENLDTETVENYFLNENISSYEIASVLSDDELNDVISIDYNVEEENLEAYLMEHADIETLMIE
jgi:hypothetical protein